MTYYVTRRILQSLPLLLLLTFATFVLLHYLPGGPLAFYEDNPNITAADLARLERQLGLDKPVSIQYLYWLTNLLRGEWGISYAANRAVSTMIWERFPATIRLTGLSLCLALLIALPVGMISALKQYSIFDHAVTTITYIGRSMPPFWTGLLLILVFSVYFRWLPAGGMYSLGGEAGWGDYLQHLVLPLTNLAMILAAKYARFLRASMLETIHQDFIRTARAKGASELSIILRHSLKNAAIPLVTIVALDLPFLFSGALYTEFIFSWPGIGRLFIESAFRFDYPVIMGIVTIISALVILSNLLADILYALLDPRIAYR
ncbi:MAG: ABC transporter permease [Nitrospinota bacterium]|nr:MAG: ABC transporter permease [Nitrospinota bacterium]